MSTDLDPMKDLANSKFQLIEFALDRQLNGKIVTGRYGINVVKVREVVRMPKINPLNTRVKGIAGVFELRGIAIPVIHLSEVLGDETKQLLDTQKIIVAEFGSKRAGFVVDRTSRIRRLDWKEIIPPTSDAESYITAMTLVENQEFLFILDLERMLHDLDHSSSGIASNVGHVNSSILPDVGPGVIKSDQALNQSSSGPRVLLVDDSSFILKNTKIGLLRAGFQVVTATNGQLAWDILIQMLEAKDQNSVETFSAVVTDVEMPQMDGFTLTKNIRANLKLSELPIVIHSSLSAKSSQEAGIALGANVYVVKNDIRNLVEALSEMIGWHQPNNKSA